MNVDKINELIRNSQGFENTLGIVFIPTPQEDTCVAELPIGKHLLQPFGVVSGGAILSLAETLAGAGSVALCPECTCVGIGVNANHIHSAREGEKLVAVGHLVHRGSQTHVWRVDVNDQDGRLVSTVTVTNFIKIR